MATTVKRRSKVDPVGLFAEHIVLKREGSVIVARAEALKKKIKDWFEETDEAYENEQGSKFFDFPQTVSDGKVEYKGMELRRSVSPRFLEDKAEAILKRKGVYAEALTPVIDQDKVYRLVQEGKITEKDLDKMFEDKETFSFWPVKGEVD